MTQVSQIPESENLSAESVSCESSFFERQYGSLSMNCFTLYFLELNVPHELIMCWTGISKPRLRNICENRNKMIKDTQKRTGKRNLANIILSNPAEANTILNVYHQLNHEKQRVSNQDIVSAFNLIKRSYIELKPTEIFLIFDRYHKIHFDGIKSPFFTPTCSNCGNLYFQNTTTAPLECPLCHIH